MLLRFGLLHLFICLVAAIVRTSIFFLYSKHDEIAFEYRLLIGGIFIGISLSSFVIWRWCCDVSDESKSGLSTRNSQTLIHSKATTKSAVVVSDSTTTDARKIPSKSVKASLRSPKEPQITTTPSKSAKTSLRSPKEPQTTTWPIEILVCKLLPYVQYVMFRIVLIQIVLFIKINILGHSLII